METELEPMTHQHEINKSIQNENNDYNEEIKEERTTTKSKLVELATKYEPLGLGRPSTIDKPSPVPDTPIDDNDKYRSRAIHFEDGNDQIIKYFQYPSKIRMKLDYGFRSIYEMYRFNYIPIIYALLSIASIYLPSAIFPKGNINENLLFYIHFICALINVLIMVYSLGIALAKVIKGDETDDNAQNDDRKKSSLPYNPTDDLEIDAYDSDDIESDSNYDLEKQTILSSSQLIPNGDPNNPQIVRNYSEVSNKSRERKISIVEGLEQNVIIKFFYKFGEQFNVLFFINEIDSRIASKIAPTFSAFIMVFCVLSCHILLAAATNEYNVCLYVNLHLILFTFTHSAFS